MSHARPPTLLLVAPDEAFVYLIERYVRRSGQDLTVLRSSRALESAGPFRAAAVWFASIQSLDEVRPRDGGLVSDDSPVIVSASHGDEARARELGADHCAMHPLTYPEFMAALMAVGLLPPGAT